MELLRWSVPEACIIMGPFEISSAARESCPYLASRNDLDLGFFWLLSEESRFVHKILLTLQLMKKLFGHLRTYIFRGFWAVIPLALTILVIRLVYVLIDQRLATLVTRTIGFGVPGLGILLLLMVLYFLGLVASNVVGRKFFSAIERLTDRVPLIKTTYRVGKQLAVSFTLPKREVFKRAVLVSYLKPGMWTIGFVTGTLLDHQQDGKALLKVYIPTPPNPTSGTIVIVSESQIRDPGWSIEEAMTMVISAGIVGPTAIN